MMNLTEGMLAALVFTLGVSTIVIIPKYKWVAAAILLVIITPLAIPGFLFSAAPLGISDWDLYFTYYHALRRTITEFGQFPMWNPWLCGGSAAWGDPEFPVFSPTFLATLALGVERGFKLMITVVTATGAVGMLLLAKRLGLSVYASLLAAVGVAFGSVNLLEVVEGHPNIFSFMWIPWVFWAWIGAYRNQARQLAEGIGDQGKNRWPVLCSIFLALTFFQGGIYLLMYTTLAFGALILLVKHHVRAFMVTFQAGLWALGFAAIKLVPTLLWLSQFPDKTYASSTYTLAWLHKIFFGRYVHGAGEPEGIIPNQGSGWHEYGAYIGPFIGALAVVGLARLHESRTVRILAIGTMCAILLSSSGPILKPIFDQVPFIPRSNISRIILFAVAPISLLAGFGLDAIRAFVSKQRTARIRTHFFQYAVTIALTALVAADLFTLSTQLSAQAFVLPYPVPQIPPAPAPIAHMTLMYTHRHNQVDYTRAYAAALAGYGTNAACNVLRPEDAVRTIHDEVNFGPVLETSMLSVRSVDWSPNRIEAFVDARESAEVMVNTNYAPGWWVQASPEKGWEPASEIQNRVGTHVDAGTHTVTFAFWPRGWKTGVAVTSLTLLLAVGLEVGRRYLLREQSHSSSRLG